MFLRVLRAFVVPAWDIGVIFEDPQVLIVWVAPSLDITAKVIERLDAASREKK